MENTSQNTVKQAVRVCHMSTAHPPFDVRIFHRECGPLAREGYEVHLIVPHDKTEIKEGVYIHGIAKAGNRAIRIFMKPWKALKEAVAVNATIYHYHDPELMFAGFILRWFYRKHVVFDVHESVPRQILYKQWLPAWSRKAIAMTYTVLEKIFTKGQAIILAPEQIHCDYPSAYLVRNYPLLDEEGMAVAAAKTQRKSPPLILYVGGVDKLRGAMIYIEMAKRLRERGRAFQLAIVGKADPPLMAEMEQKIRDYQLQDVVTMPGPMPYKKAMEYINEASIGLCLLLPVPNNVIGLSTKIFEYMMYSTPVLTSNFASYKKYVEEEKAGMMVDPENIDQVVDACDTMLSNPEELREMGRRGMVAVRDRYNWASEFKEILHCYQNLLKA